MLAAGTLLTTVTAAPAQAYDPDPTTYVTRQATDNCPCTHGDLIDGTYFHKDAGGVGVKILATVGKASNIVGKVEFHPLDEKLWIYDTKNDGDALYAQVTWSGGGSQVYKAPGTAKSIDVRTVDLNIPEDTYVSVKLFDGNGTDLIQSTQGRA
ncbi:MULTISPECIES: hypothetical protein [unclassified Streptomyces]|uniref:hypothetical protein n=1 Tax=unclassified Streptomyces TaxID=2593676 RepID=UPI00234A9371|nr:hypothetical protein [Streptomyces sp. M92]WCN05224.1 hypothetical protein M6G08_25690 [Streptomyces sp. M92]